MTVEYTAKSGQDPLISDMPVATEMPNGDHPKVEIVSAPVESKNKGFDAQPPTGSPLWTIDPLA